jgi:class 3 adenylate cyclase
MTLAVAMALGPVIAGEMGPASIRRFDVFGHAANLAARLLRGADFRVTEHLAEAASDADLAGIDIVPGV